MTKEKFDFPKEKGLETYSAIYVPATQDVNKPITKKEHERRANKVRNFLNRRFGGTTSVSAVGSYTDSKGRIIKEPVIKVENFSDYSDYIKHDKEIRNFIEKETNSWGQESILYEFESPKKPRRVVFVSSSKRKLKDVA